MIRVAALSLAICIAASTISSGSARAADPPDLGKIKRRIAKEPTYTAKQPLYALYVFGPQAKTHVWAVLDKSKPDAPHYDVLFFDRNADGDLTATDERIEGKVSGGDTTFEIGSFTDLVSKQTHTDISIRRTGGEERSMTMLRMKWCDRVSVRGGYAPESGPYTQFAPTLAEAPILWPGADGSFSFQFWMIDTLHVGESEDVRVFLGHRGIGKNTFCAVPDTFLPMEIPVIATLIYRDKDDKEQRARSELRERC